MFRVADFAQFQRTLMHSMTAQAKSADAQTQIASGKKAQSYGDMAPQSQALLENERVTAQTTQFLENIARADARLNVMDGALSRLGDEISHLLSLVSQALTSSFSADTPLEETAATFKAEVQSLLNTRHEGRYVFAGARTDTAPVDLADVDYDPQAGLPGTFTPDLDYFQGDDTVLSIRADKDLEVEYGVTAGEPGFEQLLRALSYLEYAGANGDEAVLEEAYNLLKGANDGVSDMRGRIGTRMKTLEQVGTRHQDTLTYAQNLVSDLEDVDVAEATARLAQDQVQLQAGYMALTRLQSLNLLEYLR